MRRTSTGGVKSASQLFVTELRATQDFHGALSPSGNKVRQTEKRTSLWLTGSLALLPSPDVIGVQAAEGVRRDEVLVAERLSRRAHLSNVARHAMHVTHDTRHTIHVTRHASRNTRHTIHVPRYRQTSHVTRHTIPSNITCHTSHNTRHMSHVTQYT